MPRTVLTLTALAWALAPWVDDAGLLVLFASVGVAWLIRHEERWWMGLVCAPMLHLVWLFSSLHDAFGWSMSSRTGATLVASLLHTLPWLVFLMVARWGRSRLPLWIALGLAAAMSEGLGPWLSPTPTLHAVLAADWAPWTLPAAFGGRAMASGILAAWGAWCLERRATAWMVATLAVGLHWVLPAGPSRIPIGVVQTDVPAWESRVHSRAQKHAEHLQQLIETVQDSDLIVTPEGSWPFDPGRTVGARRTTFHRMWRSETPVLLGATVGRTEPFANSVWLVGGREVLTIDKQHLVPGWETPSFGWGKERYQSGQGSRVVRSGATEIGVAICYEDWFESTFREAADVWIVATNDSWLGTSGRSSHLNAARLMAVSTGRSVVRSSTDGRSTWFDAWGRMQDTLPIQGQGSAAVWSVSHGGWPHPGARCSPWVSGLAWLLLVASRMRS